METKLQKTLDSKLLDLISTLEETSKFFEYDYSNQLYRGLFDTLSNLPRSDWSRSDRFYNEEKMKILLSTARKAVSDAISIRTQGDEQKKKSRLLIF